MGCDFAETVLSDELGRFILKHIVAIQRTVACCAASIFVVNVEANLVFGAPAIYQYIRQNPPGITNAIVLMQEDSRTHHNTMGGEGVITAGTRTTPQNKPAMIEGLGRILRAERLFFHQQMVSVLMEYLPEHHKVKPIVTLIKELGTFMREVSYPKSSKDQAYVRPVIRYRGEKGVDRDDGVMALAIGVFQMSIFFGSSAYGEWH